MLFAPLDSIELIVAAKRVTEEIRTIPAGNMSASLMQIVEIHWNVRTRSVWTHVHVPNLLIAHHATIEAFVLVSQITLVIPTEYAVIQVRIFPFNFSIFNLLLFSYQSQSQLLRSQGVTLTVTVQVNKPVSVANAWIPACISNLVSKMLNVQWKMSFPFVSWCALANLDTLGREMRDVTW